MKLFLLLLLLFEQVHGTLETIIGKAMVPLWAAGFNVLAVDLRNHGLSDDSKPVSLGLHEVRQ